ncbi:hypothetical protein ABQE92_18690 [Mycolicibacterium thermoresistibile]
MTALLAAGCAGSDEAADDAAPPATPGTTAGAAPTEPTDPEAAEDQLVIDVTIEGGEVTPTNERFQGRVGEPIMIRVNSDAPDELHVHSIPEHTFAVEPRAGQAFEFTVDVPGQVEIELHDLHRTIATVQVRQ